MDPVNKSDLIGLLFKRDRTGTGPERIRTDPKLDLLFTDPILDPFGSVPDRFQNDSVQIEADPARFGTVPVRSRVNAV